MSTNLIEMREALMRGVRTCNMVSPAKMTAEQRDQYAQAHLFLEQLGERLVDAGDFLCNAVSTVDRIRRMR